MDRFEDQHPPFVVSKIKIINTMWRQVSDDDIWSPTNKQNTKPTSLLSLPPSSNPPATVKTPSTLEPARSPSLLGSLGPLLHEVALLLNKNVYFYIFLLYLQMDDNLGLIWSGRCLEIPIIPVQDLNRVQPTLTIPSSGDNEAVLQRRRMCTTLKVWGRQYFGYFYGDIIFKLAHWLF